MKRTLFIVYFLLFCTVRLPAEDSDAVPASPSGELDVTVDINGSVASNGAIRPLWSYSQEWGRHTQYKQLDGAIYTKFNYHWQNRKNWFSINVGAALEASSDRNLTMLHEAYVSGRIWELGYTFGREAYTAINQHGDLGLGSYIMGDNARPYTRFGIGFFDYWAIPKIKNWIELKGAFFIGFMPNETDSTFTRNALIHEKFAYIRIGRFHVKPYVGIMHSVMMGGTLADGRAIPLDFWASFCGKGSKKMMDAGFTGEYYNAAGGHQGMWDVGLDFDFAPVSASLYYRRPFSDVTAINLFNFSKCKDFTVGATVKLKDFKPVKGLNLEYLTTMWQGGNGPADPMFISSGPEKTGEEVWLAQKEVSPDVLRKYLGPQVSEWESATGHPLTQDECGPFMKKYILPPGWDWGNRTPYLENSFYPQGWTVGGLAMGYPLMLTSTTMKAVAPGYNFFRRFSNVRLWAINYGMAGEIIPGLDYKFKFTYSCNCGSYCEEYYSGARFAEKRPDYYFSVSKNEFYTGLWLDYHWRCFTFKMALNCDFGDIYRSFSARLGMSISINALKPWNKQYVSD